MYIGLDVHKRVCYGTVMDEKGIIVKRGKFSNDPHGLEEFMDGVDEALVAMEAGYCWQPLYDGLPRLRWRHLAERHGAATRVDRG